MNFADRIRTLRMQHHLTQKQICTNIGLSGPGYRRYEDGTREPDYQKFLALADYFGVSLDYLAGRTDNPEINR